VESEGAGESSTYTLTSLGWRKSEVQAQRNPAGTISAVFGSLDKDAEVVSDFTKELMACMGFFN
jgi:hypothetical protein